MRAVTCASFVVLVSTMGTDVAEAAKGVSAAKAASCRDWYQNRLGKIRERSSELRPKFERDAEYAYGECMKGADPSLAYTDPSRDGDSGSDGPSEAAGPASSSCSMGPKCKVANDRAMAYTNGPAKRFLSGGAANAAVGAFCVNRYTAEVVRFCADEQTALGKHSCASLLRAQQRENLRVAEQSRVSAGHFMAGSPNWRTVCNVQGRI